MTAFKFYIDSSNHYPTIKLDEISVFVVSAGVAVFDISLDDQWIKFNHDHSGFFRVNYDPELWSLLTNQLNTGYAVRYNMASYHC